MKGVSKNWEGLPYQYPSINRISNFLYRLIMDCVIFFPDAQIL